MDKNVVSLGTILRRTREEQNLSLESVSATTKINVNYLQHIESDEFDFLQGPYVLAFLKTYAQVLNLNAEEIREKFFNQEKASLGVMYSSAHETEQVRESSDTASFNSPNDSKNRMTLTKSRSVKTIPVIGMIAALLIVVLIMQKLFTPHEEEANLYVDSSPLQSQSDDVEIIAEQQQVATSPLTLRLVTHEQLWLSVAVDANEQREYLLNPGETQMWSGFNTISLRVGKSTGFDLYFNNEQIENLGSESTMIGRLVLSRSGIEDLQLLNRTFQESPDSTVE